MNLSRRNFIVTGSAVVGGAAFGLSRTLTAAPEARVEAFGGFKVGIQSNSISRLGTDLDRVLGHVADVGLRWVELQRSNIAITQEQAHLDEIAAKLEQRQIDMGAYFLSNITEPADELRQIFEFARKAGVTLLAGQPSPESFPALDALVKEFDIKVGIHNYGPGRQYDRAEDAIKAAEPWDARIGYCLDTGHCMRSGENPVEVVRQMGTRLHGLHLREQDSMTRGQSRETVIGEGALDLRAFCRALRDVKFDGPVSFEMYLSPDDPLPVLRRSVSNFAAAARATA